MSQAELEREDGKRATPVPVDVGADTEAAQRPSEIWVEGLDEGERRLARSSITHASTALVGGIDIMIGVAVTTVIAGSLSGLVPATTAGVVGSLAFGIGFVFLTIGRGELFTENFLIPVGTLLERRSSWRQLGRLWSVTLVANLVGMFIFAAILAKETVLDHSAVVAGGHTADVFAARDFSAALLSAICAGTLMTLWTWLNTAARTDIARVMIALLVGFALAAPQLNHVMVGTGEMMFGVLGGQAHVANWGAIGINFLISLAGNVIGGMGFVTLTRFVQARSASAAGAG